MVTALVYSSQANPSLTDTELELILIRSRVLNAARGITGALLKRGAGIVQYLEGDAAAIDRTFGRIAASPFHREIRVLARAAPVDRQFASWHMAFHDFQRQHQRMDATGHWLDVVPAARAAARGNAPLSVLMDWWDGSGSEAQPAG